MNKIPASLRLGPHPCLFAFAEKFQVNDVGIAADWAIFDIFLFAAAGGIERDDNLLTATRADVLAFIGGSASFFLPLFHKSMGVKKRDTVIHHRCHPLERPGNR